MNSTDDDQHRNQNQIPTATEQGITMDFNNRFRGFGDRQRKAAAEDLLSHVQKIKLELWLGEDGRGVECVTFKIEGEAGWNPPADQDGDDCGAAVAEPGQVKKDGAAFVQRLLDAIS